MDYAKESLKKHYEWKGKLEVLPKVPVADKDDLSLAYTPGVAEPCLEIQKDVNKSFELTGRWNTVAVVSDGTAVLGLGDIGPEASMPVMEGKCVLFKAFGGVDAIPLCVRSKKVEDIVETVRLLAGSFGGVNLEDISAPRCFEIERRLKECCDIPIFHDDQHGTAIVASAAMINAAKVVSKKIEEMTVVINGAGAAGCAVAKQLIALGVADIIMVDIMGIICDGDKFINNSHYEIAELTNKYRIKGTLSDAMADADAFIGVSKPDLVNEDMIKSMADKPIVFAMANPVPEIMPEAAKKAGAFVVGTGRSDFPNQINNVIAFPGVFKGALAARASDINEDMKLAAAYAISDSVAADKLCADYILPDPFDRSVADRIAKAVSDAAVESGVARIKNYSYAE